MWIFTNLLKSYYWGFPYTYPRFCGKQKKAEGSIEWGAELYDKHCTMCHGDFGLGGKGYPPLNGEKKYIITGWIETADSFIADEFPRENFA